MATYQQHWLWQGMFTLGFGRIVRPIMKDIFKPDDVVAVSECRAKLVKTVEDIENMYLKDNKKGIMQYLFMNYEVVSL